MLAQEQQQSTVPLRRWIENESKKETSSPSQPEDSGHRRSNMEKEMLLRKTTVAYGMTELMKHVITHQYQHQSRHSTSSSPSTSTSTSLLSSLPVNERFCIDNISVRVSNYDGDDEAALSSSSSSSCNNIKGVDMVSPHVSMNIIEPYFLSTKFSLSDNEDDVEEHEDQIMGRYLQVEFESESATSSRASPHADNAVDADASDNDDDDVMYVVSQSEANAHCHSLGVIFYELFSYLSPLEVRLVSTLDGKASYFPLRELGFPVSISLMVQNLLECGEEKKEGEDEETQDENTATGDSKLDKGNSNVAYDSLETLSQDLHLLLLDPNRFLFDQEQPPPPPPLSSLSENNDEAPTMPLLFREHKLYGREKETSLITDAFCRVSGGKSEALFIGGFSGVGKSRLVNSLTAHVDMAGGYVLTHKFDQMSKELPMLEVISLFNDLCLLIAQKRSKQDRLVMAKAIMEVFDADFTMLSRLLPNIDAIIAPTKDSNQIIDLVEEGSGGVAAVGGGRMNLQSVCFLLQRFTRVVSSTTHPVMLFLDDLQWCDNKSNPPSSKRSRDGTRRWRDSSALALIEGILCDNDVKEKDDNNNKDDNDKNNAIISSSSSSKSSCCFFFVGSYRSNQVSEDHAIFHFMDSARSSGVPVTKISLEGLTPRDINAMVSDALCMFPRICEPLSNIVFQKTKGNPYFVLEFVRTLRDRSLLQFSTEKMTWVWDEDRINSMDITSNVLYLLSRKMSGLSENVQLALKVAACFGIKIKKSVVEYLSSNSDYSNIPSGLEQVVAEGFMIMVGTSYFKFVHDKVREAAYSLIPNSEKKKYHYHVGISLYLAAKGSILDDIVFSIAGQINHGMGFPMVRNPELWLDLAKLNEKAAAKAVDSSDYGAARSYVNAALPLLPKKHWKNHYDLSLRLYFLLAKSSHWCGDLEKASDVLQTILRESQHTYDKLNAYHLFVLVLHDGGETAEAYRTLFEVLLQLGESIPKKLSPTETNKMYKTTANMLTGLTEESLLEMKMMDRTSQFRLKFYNSIAVVANMPRGDMVPFFACRMVQLTLDSQTICKYSLIGLVQYAAIGCGHNNLEVIQEACRIGKLAVAALKKFDSYTDIIPRLFFIYYALVASYLEPVHACAANLLKGFECGIACGDTSSAFFNAIHHIRISLIAGTPLPILLKKTEYLLEVIKSHGNTIGKTHLLLHRDTILTLMGKGYDYHSAVQDDPMEAYDPKKPSAPLYHYHKSIRAFWLGHCERGHYFFEKLTVPGLVDDVVNWRMREHRKFFSLYHGINTFGIIKPSSDQRLKETPINILEGLKISAAVSRWNFHNKACLLAAEIYSYKGNHQEAKVNFAAAITSARCSNFIHEQGLACERAGFHYKKIGQLAEAYGFFNQAKQCYAKWGSQLKVDSVTRQLESIQIKA